jgi:hypothetical protein
MKAKNLLLLFSVPLGLTTAVMAEDDLPRAPKFARYEAMVKHSPFAVATAAAPAGATPDLYVANAAHTTDGDFVTIASTTDKNFKEYLNSKEPIDGYTVPTIQWSEQVGETKVTIAKDGQFATLAFNEALLSQTIQNAPQMPQPPQPGMIGRLQPNAPVPMPRPNYQLPTPPPHVRPPIRRKAAPQHQQPQVPEADEPGE